MKNWSEFKDFGLYLVTDHDLCLGRPILDVVEQAIAGGVKTVQIREKHGNTRDFLALAKLLVRDVQSKGVPVIINDRVDIALASGAAGVHVGQSDMPADEARKILGENAIIGISTPTMEALKACYTLPVQYLASGPVFPTKTKTDTAMNWGLDKMKEAKEFLLSVNCHIPFMAIGGITPENSKSILETGVESLAVVSALCSAKDPKIAAQEFCKAWEK